MLGTKRGMGMRRQPTLPARMSGTCAIVALLTVVGLGAAADRETLVGAARRGDTRALRALVQQHVDVNAPDTDGTTALHWAVHHDDLQAVDLLVSAGARVNAANQYGVPPLVLASTNGNAAIVERLLQARADPNTSVPGGETVLMTAARTGNVEVLKMLLARGADVNARETTRGQTALMWAAAEGNAAAIGLLIEARADINARSHGPKPPEAKATNPSRRPGSQDDEGLNDAVSRDWARRGRVDDYTPLLFAVRAGRLDRKSVV